MTALAVDALAAVRAAGGDVKLVGPKRLKVIAPAPLPDYLVDRLRTAKPELLSLLSSTNPPATEIWDEAEEERAAIVEYDGGAPRAWAEALARLDPARPPCDIPPKRWLCFIDDCGRFLDDGWLPCAEALGWGPHDCSAATASNHSPASTTLACSGCSTARSFSLSPPTRRPSPRPVAAALLSEDVRMSRVECWPGSYRLAPHR
jgi:hypothetical protein